MGEGGGKIGQALDAAILQEPQVRLAARVAGEDDRLAGQRHGVALVDRRVGEAHARPVLGVETEEVVLAALGRVAGVDDAVLAPGEVALAVEVLGQAPRVRVGRAHLDDVDVDLSVAVEPVERQPLPVGAEGGIARLDDPIADDADLPRVAQLEIDLGSRVVEGLRLAPLHGRVVQHVRVARLGDPGDACVVHRHHRAQYDVEALHAGVLVDGDLVRRGGIAPVDEHQLGARRLALHPAVEDHVAVLRAGERVHLVGELQLRHVGQVLLRLQVRLHHPLARPGLPARVHLRGLLARHAPEELHEALARFAAPGLAGEPRALVEHALDDALAIGLR